MHNPFGANRTKEDWHLSQDDLVLYIDGEMPSKETAKTRDHIEACWTCRTKMQKIQETISAFVDYLDGSFARNLDPPPRRWRTFQAQLHRVIGETRKPPTDSSWFDALRNAFPGLHLGVRFVGAILVATFTFLVLLVFNRVPRVSANQLIQKAAEAQAQRIRGVSHPVVYQKLRVRRKSKFPVEESSLTWEVWNDESNDRFRQRAEDVNGQRFIDPQRSVTRVRRPEQLQRADNGPGYPRAPELLTAPPMLRELEGIFRANQMDLRRPVSAASFESCRRSAPRDSEAVADTSLPNGDKALTLTTAAAGPFAANTIIKAVLVVRTEDWHPVEQRLEVQEEDGVRDYDLTETAFEVVSLNNLNPLIFADLESPALRAPASRPLTMSPLRFPTDAELMAAEINAQYALHRLRACVGESIEVSRDSTGHVEVRGVVETPERKQQLLAALQGLPVVKANIQTIAETTRTGPAPLESSRQSEKPEEGALAPPGDIVQVQSSKLPIEDQLREHFARIGAGANPAREGEASLQARIEKQITELSSQAVSVSLAASAEAGALRQLAENYPAARIEELDPASKWLLEIMVRDHLAALKTRMARSLALLSPVLSSFGKQNPEYLPREDNCPADVSDSAGSTWNAQTFCVFTTVEHAERITDYLFAGSSLPSGEEEAVRDLLADLNQVDNEIQRLQKSIDQNFSGRPQAASITDRAQ